MTDFWPAGIELDDTETPMQILESARETWLERSAGELSLALQDTETTDGDRMIVVHAQHVESKRTVTLFSVIHRPEAPYPAKIQPRDDALPDFLRKHYYKPGIGDIAANFSSTGKMIENQWVCETPVEFRRELKGVFNLGMLKAEILSLVSSSRPQELGSDITEEIEAEPECDS